MTIEVREAVPSDFDAVADLTVDAYRTISPQLGTYEARLRDVAGRASQATVLVATLEREIVGSATYVAGAASPLAESDDPGDAGIRMLAVAPRAMGRGAGTALVNRCVTLAREAGKRRIVLLSRTEMVAAQRIYRRLGFARAPELDEHSPSATLLGFALDL